MGTLTLQEEQVSPCSSSFQQLAGLPIQDRLSTALGLQRAGRAEQASLLYEAVLREEPEHFLCLHHLGLIAHQGGQHAQAADLVERALRVNPDYIEAHANLVAIYRALGRPDQAIDQAEKALAVRPDYPQAFLNMGGAYEDKGEFKPALTAYQQAIALNPGFVEAACNIANILRKLDQFDKAITVCTAMIKRRPDAAEPYFQLGNNLLEKGRPKEARQAYERALLLKPYYPEVHVQLGHILLAAEDYTAAIKAYETAISQRPGYREAYIGLGGAFEGNQRTDEAIAAYRKVLSTDPNLLSLRVWLLHKRRSICDWDAIMEEEAELLSLLEKDTTATNPFSCLSMATTAADQLRIAQNYAAQLAGIEQNFQHSLTGHRSSANPRLRIGYLSADFYAHATALLMVELFERHDRSSFEIIAYSHGPEDFSELGLRVRDAFDRFIDIRDLSDSEAAKLIHDDEIDILIDLKGFTKNARTGILARRPAPCQVNFIGYPGTMGASFIDYVIADPIVLPMDQQPHFAEKIVQLPHCYQPNDSRRQIADLLQTRTDCGLPEDGFVFCCFNNSYKLTPPIFDIWMRLLQGVPGSVLWLLDAQQMVKENLGREAESRGVDPKRLIFAPRVSIPHHLARQRLADLFLDCLPYNAHTTASDALWAGLPVLTCMGTTFASRVAGSLLTSVGLPELVTYSLQEYEALALRIAREPPLLQAIKHQLLGRRLNAPLFDITRYTRDLEQAFSHMWQLWSDGRPTEPFAVTSEHQMNLPKVIERIGFGKCPLCNSLSIEAYIGADCSKHPSYRSSLPAEVNWLRCESCHHLFTEGYFDADVCARYFAKTPPHEYVGFDMENLRLGAAKYIERVARHMAKVEGEWLDVNFGNASLLFSASEWGFVPVGLEHRQENVSILQGLGIEAHFGTILSFEGHKRFSVISLRDVLDKMAFPQAGLRAAHRLLCEDGVLYLSMPNIGSMVWQFLHANQANPYWGEIQNVHLFSRERLFALLAEHGFKPVYFNIDDQGRARMEVIAVPVQLAGFDAQ